MFASVARHQFIYKNLNFLILKRAFESTTHTRGQLSEKNSDTIKDLNWNLCQHKLTQNDVNVAFGNSTSLEQLMIVEPAHTLIDGHVKNRILEITARYAGKPCYDRVLAVVEERTLEPSKHQIIYATCFGSAGLLDGGKSLGGEEGGRKPRGAGKPLANNMPVIAPGGGKPLSKLQLSAAKTPSGKDEKSPLKVPPSGTTPLPEGQPKLPRTGKTVPKGGKQPARKTPPSGAKSPAGGKKVDGSTGAKKNLPDKLPATKTPIGKPKPTGAKRNLPEKLPARKEPAAGETPPGGANTPGKKAMATGDHPAGGQDGPGGASNPPTGNKDAASTLPTGGGQDGSSKPPGGGGKDGASKPPSSSGKGGGSSTNELVKPPIKVPGISGRYAHALYSAAVKTGNVDRVEQDLIKLEEVFKKDRKFEDFLREPGIPMHLKVEALKAIKKFDISDITVNFANLVLENKRMDKMLAIIHGYFELMIARKGIVKCEVITAAPLTPEQKDKLHKILEQFLPGKKAEMTETLNPTLIGGIILTVGDKHIDLSMQRLFNRYEQLISVPI